MNNPKKYSRDEVDSVDNYGTMIEHARQAAAREANIRNLLGGLDKR